MMIKSELLLTSSTFAIARSAAIAFTILLCGTSYAAETISISISSDAPKPGETISITATPSSPPNKNIGITFISEGLGLSRRVINPPYTISTRVPSNTNGKAFVYAVAIVNDAVVSSSKVQLSIKDPAKSVTSIGFGDDLILLYELAGSYKLAPFANLSDGSSVSLSTEDVSYEITDSSGNNTPSAVSITANNYISGKLAGEYKLKIRYGDSSASIPVVVQKLPSGMIKDSGSGVGSSDSGQSASSGSPSQSGGGAVSPMAAIGLLFAIGALAIIRRQDKKAIVQK